MEIEFLNANVMDTTLLLGSTGIFDTSSDGQLWIDTVAVTVFELKCYIVIALYYLN